MSPAAATNRGLSADDLGHVHALVIHWGRKQLSPGRHESLARGEIVGGILLISARGSTSQTVPE
jgi:hypothetical protein